MREIERPRDCAIVKLREARIQPEACHCVMRRRRLTGRVNYIVVEVSEIVLRLEVVQCIVMEGD